MSGTELASLIIQAVFGWPLVIIILLWTQREPVGRFIDRVKSASVAGATFETADAQDLATASQASALASAVQSLEGRIETLLVKLDPSRPAASPLPEVPQDLIDSTPWQEAELFAERLPRPAVSQAWLELRRRIEIALAGVDPSTETRGRTATDPDDTATLRLLQGGVTADAIDQGWIEGWKALRRVYTRSLTASPSGATALRTIETAESLARTLPEVWQAVQARASLTSPVVEAPAGS